MEKRWWVIESPTRGVFKEFDDDGKPHFRWSTARGSEGDYLFDTREAAERYLAAKFKEPLKSKCYVFGPIAQYVTLRR
jgi:hypothetical protein